MKIDLTDTTSSKINSALMGARRAGGASAAGMVLTLVIVTEEGSAYDALKAANDASREHPRASSPWSSARAAHHGRGPGPGWTPRSGSAPTPARVRP